MFGFRTPKKGQNPAHDEPQPSTSSGYTGTHVRRSIGEWETGRPKEVPKTITAPPKAVSVEPPKLKSTRTLSQESRVVARRSSTEAAGSPPIQHKPKYADRLAEAKACVTKAKIQLGNSRNIKTEIKSEVTQAIDRLYQLVKEAESAKEPTEKKTNEQEKEKGKEPEKEKEPEKDQRKEEKELMRKLEEHTKLIQESNEKMDRLKETIEKQQEMQEKMTYASVAAANPKRTEQITLHSVVVSAVNEMETGEEVLNRIRKAVNAKESGITVERIRKAKDRKVIIGCRTDEERQRVKERLRSAKELNVEEIKNKDPLVILRDVLKHNTDEDVLSALANQNKGVIGELSGRTVEIAFKKRTRNPHTHHIVLRVSPDIWQRLTEAGSVRIDLQRVRVADQSPLVQCSLCLGYGHGRRFCEETQERCCHCGGPHMKSDCADWLADVSPSCSNCVNAKLDKTDHNAFSSECPIRRKWDALARATIAYC